MKNELVGKCGFCCEACPTYIKGNCKGCILEHTEGDCYTRDCVIKNHLEFCGQCDRFPCNDIITKPRSTVLDKEWLKWKKQADTNR